MKRPHLRNLLILIPVSLIGAVLVLVVVRRGTTGAGNGLMSDSPELKPVVLKDGGFPPRDPAFLLLRALDVAQVPVAARFDAPLGSEHGALTYDAQPFQDWNSGRGSRHLGLDLNGIGGGDSDLGDPVYAAGAGRVILVGDGGSGWGNMAIVVHALVDPDGKGRQYAETVYAHLDRLNVAVGMGVGRGEVIGWVGTAGGAYPAHLHFEVRRSDTAAPGGGYAEGTLNREDPAIWLAERRGAPPEALNPGPRDPVDEARFEAR